MSKRFMKIVASSLCGAAIGLWLISLLSQATWLGTGYASPLQAIIPAIGLAKQAAAAVSNGDGTFDITYVIRVGNYSTPPQPLTNVQVQDNLNTTFGPTTTFVVVGAPTTSPGLTPNPSYNGNTNLNLLSGTDTIPITSTLYLITFTVRITPNGFFGPYNNVAGGAATVGVDTTTDSSTTGTNPDPNNNTNPTDENTPTAVTVIAVADPAITKSASPAAAQVGDVVTYVLVVTNNCAACNMAATNVLVTDVVPAFLTVLGATTTQGAATVTGNTVVINIGTLNLNAVVTITIQTRANAQALPPSNVNSVTLTSPQDAVPTNDVATTAVTILATAPPVQVPEGDTLLLVATGLAGLAGYARLRWRARRAKPKDSHANPQ